MTTPEHSPEPSRRAVLTAAVWSAPVVAATVALPLAAASTASEYAVVLRSASPQPAGASDVNVTFPQSALPIAAGSTRLTYRRTAGTGTITGGGLPPTWTYVWPSGDLLYFTPPENPSLTENVFTISFSGPSSWSIELTTPAGAFVALVEVLAP